jgi:chromatin remodeling complex protein RSC6
MEAQEEQHNLISEVKDENEVKKQETIDTKEEETKEEKQDLFEEADHDRKIENASTDNNSVPIQADLETDLFGEDEGTIKEDARGEEETIKNLVTEILRASNLDEISMKQIREELTMKHSIDCQKHKKLIRDTIDSYLAEHPVEDDNQEITDALGERNTVKKRKSGIHHLLPFLLTSLNRLIFVIVFAKPAYLSPALSELVGVEMAPRSEVVKFLWKYIKENNLQNPKDKRIILFDEKLQKIFKKKSSHFMKLTKLLFNVSRCLLCFC